MSDGVDKVNNYSNSDMVIKNSKLAVGESQDIDPDSIIFDLNLTDNKSTKYVIKVN